MIERKALDVSLTPELHAFVRALVKSGNYANHSGGVRAGLRLLRPEEERRRLGFNSPSSAPPENRA
ncbi:type II toxin-antitoxin system ParD family antitoxin [Methylobacterium sp. E-005]|uniref:ribbon-helix-helix domain-containing protein n=1 Tax=Methylobacterium sp. E-005 TaxID=2836549 RepID=UPI001FBB2648|nr:type II toxin-antitoxin system ParD family antitoxin [Methylobacterium sp. E-005]MCJ2088127.1 type II toxin-antitoxin system ParD family antitoxin [Methylobacterium sp. E-005]